MKSVIYIFIVLLSIVSGSCVTQFTPQTNEESDMLAVEGLITNQRGINTVILSRSMPLASKNTAIPAIGYSVTITDDSGNFYPLSEKAPGTYITDSISFTGIVGRKYKLTIRSNNFNTPNYTFESLPLELKPVPPIDSVYYKKVIIESGTFPERNGCQIYLDTHDPQNECKFYRWDYTETWEFHLPYLVANNVCWISDKSSVINIKTTNSLSEDKIIQYPLKFISPNTDRLSVNYSILVNQYSLNEDEYNYWSKIQNISEEVGTLYDITPASIPGNIFCLEDPEKTVLGYFSVSSKFSKRIFIKENFTGLIYLYGQCPHDSVWLDPKDTPGFNSTHWIIIDGSSRRPPYWVLTDNKGCADCTVRGTNVKPTWWK